MKIGDKVKVKSWKEILKTVDERYHCLNPCKNGDSTYFNRVDMFQYVSSTGTISKIDDTTGNVYINFTDQTCVCWWHPSWLDLIPEELNIDKDCSSKWLIFCMIFQYLSGNCPNPSIFKYFYTPSKEDGGFNFLDFQYKFIDLKRGAAPFPDWPILNIPLDEAYKILKYCYKYGKSKKTLDFFTHTINRILFNGFTWSDTPEGTAYWNKRDLYYVGVYSKLEKLKKPISQTKSEILTTQIKIENYENKLQRKKSIVIRGTVPEGSITCGRKRKTSIAVGYLSNSVCIGG